MWYKRLKGSFFTLFFILLNLFYLVIELSFNARVLDVSSGLSAHNDFGQLEVYGRTISATGATILAWRLLLPYQLKHNWQRVIARFLLIAFIVFPLVFIGQKKLVDDLVDLSSAQTRRSAELLSLLKFGIANGFVAIDELALDEITRLSAEGKMFITLSGLLAYNSSHMRAVMEDKLETIATYAIATQRSADSRPLYRNYQYIRQQVVQRYQQYLLLEQQLESQQAQAAQQAIGIYQNAMNKALLQWQNYQQQMDADPSIKTVSPAQVGDIARLLATSQHYVSSCVSEQCFDEGLETLEFRLSRLLGVLSPLTEWCHQANNDYTGRRLECIQDSQIKNRIIQARLQALALQSGLSRVYADRLQFLRSADFRSAVFSALREQGVDINPRWNFAAYQVMLDDIAAQLRENGLQQYNQAVEAAFGATIAPRTELVDFNRLDSVQALYHQVLGNKTEQFIAINLAQGEFGDQLVAPLYVAKLNTLLARLKSAPDWFADDAPYAESGKSSLRTLVVPPVALAFSLIFGLLNLMTLILSFVFVIVQESRRLRWLGILILISCIVWLPLGQQYQIYSQQAYQDLLAQTRMQYGDWAYFLDWLAKTEPQVYPVANLLRQNLLDGFNFN